MIAEGVDWVDVTIGVLWMVIVVCTSPTPPNWMGRRVVCTVGSIFLWRRRVFLVVVRYRSRR